jgi:hypothetical protein
LRHWPIAAAVAGSSRKTAARVKRGVISLSSSSHFTLMVYSNRAKPVELPPGRAKLRPSPEPLHMCPCKLADDFCSAAFKRQVEARHNTRWGHCERKDFHAVDQNRFLSADLTKLAFRHSALVQQEIR